MEAWKPSKKSRIRAEHLAETRGRRWSRDNPAPWTHVHDVVWVLIEDGLEVSARTIADFAGWGKSKAGELIAEVQVDRTEWYERTLGGHLADSERTNGGQTTEEEAKETTREADSERTASGQHQPSRARSSSDIEKRNGHGQSEHEQPGASAPEPPPADAGLSVSTQPSEVQDHIPDWIPSAKNVAPYTRLAVLGMVAASVEAITGAPFVPLRGRTCGAQVLSLWKAVGSPEPSCHSLDMALVADAAKRCPNRIFSHDIRGEGWDGAVDRSRSVATLCAQKRWDERLAAAKEWDSNGRPEKERENDRSKVPISQLYKEYFDAQAV